MLYNFEQLHLKKRVCVCLGWGGGKTRKCFAGRYMYFYTYNSPQTMATSLLDIYIKSKFTLISALCLRSSSPHAGPIPNRSHWDHVMKKTISYALIYSKLPQSHPKHLNFWRLVCPYSCTLRPKLHYPSARFDYQFFVKDNSSYHNHDFPIDLFFWAICFQSELFIPKHLHVYSAGPTWQLWFKFPPTPKLYLSWWTEHVIPTIVTGGWA